MLYATDASIYQVEPIGVVVPHSVDDAVKALGVLAEEGVAVLPRGSGTALAGQSVNEAVIVDFSQHCRAILSVDVARRRAVVEPGVTLDQLNEALSPHGLLFGPDVATSSTAAGFVSRIAFSRASESRTVSKPMIASPRSFGLATSETSARSVVASVPSPPHTRCARLTLSKVPGVERSSWSRKMSSE